VLTTFDDDETVFAALRAGASGFLVKDVEPEELLQAVRVVARGDALLSPSVTRAVIGAFTESRSGQTPSARSPAARITPSPAARDTPSPAAPGSAGSAASPAASRPSTSRPAAPSAGVRAAPPGLASLTDREREVVALVATGLSNDEIARQLVVSPLTAKTHVSRAMTKLQARDRAQLVVFAYEYGLTAP